MFAGVTTEICAQAWELVLPGIEKGHAAGLLNGLRGGLAVLDPATPGGKPLFTAGIGEEGPKFIEFATAKARLAAREQIDTSRLRQDFPHRYRPGDIKWPGGVVRDGLAFGFSGVQGDYDEMICDWMAAAIRAICRIQFAEADKEGGPFLG
jgi:hypothetical protein